MTSLLVAFAMIVALVLLIGRFPSQMEKIFAVLMWLFIFAAIYGIYSWPQMFSY